MKECSFVAIELPDCNSIWLEFKLENEEVLVSEIKAEKEMNIEEFVVNVPKKRSKFFWQESISKDELFNTILDTTNNFMKDILAINKLLAESREFKELQNRYVKAKNCLKE